MNGDGISMKSDGIVIWPQNLLAFFVWKKKNYEFHGKTTTFNWYVNRISSSRQTCHIYIYFFFKKRGLNIIVNDHICLSWNKDFENISFLHSEKKKRIFRPNETKPEWWSFFQSVCVWMFAWSKKNDGRRWKIRYATQKSQPKFSSPCSSRFGLLVNIWRA